jgi:hypothetical protein
MLSLGKVIAMNDAAAPVRPVAAIATSETRHSGVVAPRVSRRPRRRFVRRVVALVMPAVLALGFAGTAAPPASAVTWTNYGSNGVAYTYPTAVGQYVTKFRNGFSTTMTGVSVPGMILGRSPASAGTQMVTYNIAVEQYYGGRWVQVATDGSGTFKSPFSTARIAMPTYYIQLGQSGYYRVAVGISWFDANHRWLGGRVYYLNAASDYRCSIAACQVGPGWIRLL